MAPKLENLTPTTREPGEQGGARASAAAYTQEGQDCFRQASLTTPNTASEFLPHVGIQLPVEQNGGQGGTATWQQGLDSSSNCGPDKKVKERSH